MRTGEYTLLLTEPGDTAGVPAFFRRLRRRCPTLLVNTSGHNYGRRAEPQFRLTGSRGEEFTAALAAELDRRPEIRLLLVDDFAAVMPAAEDPEVQEDFLDHCWQPLLDYASVSAVLLRPERLYTPAGAIDARAAASWIVREFPLLDRARTVVACRRDGGELRSCYFKEHHRLLVNGHYTVYRGRQPEQREEDCRHA